LRHGVIREKKAQEGVAQDRGNFADCLIQRGVVIAHGGVLSETTHDDLRFAVESASGECDRRGVPSA
jgi:hypothetical protein